MSARRKARLVPAGRLTTREKLWAAMRELKHFTVPELARAAGVDRHAYNIRDYLLGLVRADILFAEPPASPGCFTVYRLQRDLGVDAPRVRRDGTVPPENAQNRMWRAMKVLRVFSVRDLVVHAARRLSHASAPRKRRCGPLSLHPRHRGQGPANPARQTTL